MRNWKILAAAMIALGACGWAPLVLAESADAASLKQQVEALTASDLSKNRQFELAGQISQLDDKDEIDRLLGLLNKRIGELTPEGGSGYTESNLPKLPQ